MQKITHFLTQKISRKKHAVSFFAYILEALGIIKQYSSVKLNTDKILGIDLKSSNDFGIKIKCCIESKHTHGYISLLNLVNILLVSYKAVFSFPLMQKC